MGWGWGVLPPPALPQHSAGGKWYACKSGWWSLGDPGVPPKSNELMLPFIVEQNTLLSEEMALPYRGLSLVLGVPGQQLNAQ